MNKLGQALVVAHPETGEIITRFTSKVGGKEFAKVRVDSMTLEVTNGFSTFSKRSAFITIDGETADTFEAMGLLNAGQPYPIEGKIVVRESVKPFYVGQKPKTKGKGGEVVTHNGMPVYRDTEFVTDLSTQDEFISTDKVGVTNTAHAGNEAAE